MRATVGCPFVAHANQGSEVHFLQCLSQVARYQRASMTIKDSNNCSIIRKLQMMHRLFVSVGSFEQIPAEVAAPKIRHDEVLLLQSTALVHASSKL